MGVAPFYQVTLADLAELADKANGQVTRTGDLTDFFDVAPMFWSSPSTKYGHKTVRNVKIWSPGSGYKCGDTIGTYWFRATVSRVSPGGGLVGVKIIEITKGDANTDETNATAINFSSYGSGASFLQETFRAGPDEAYMFHDPTTPSFSFYVMAVVSAGSGYVVGDEITVPVFGGISGTVSETTAGGGILGVDFSTIQPSGLQNENGGTTAAASGGSGTGAVLSLGFTINYVRGWLEELNRLRDNIRKCLSSRNSPQRFIGQHHFMVSGPWPTDATPFKGAELYYADTGRQEGLNVWANNGTSFSAGDFTVKVINYASRIGEPPYSYWYELAPLAAADSLICEVVVAGNQPLTISGRFSKTLYHYPACECKEVVYAGDDGSLTRIENPNAADLVDIDSNHWLPGAAWTKTKSGDRVICECVVNNLAIQPGRYRVKFTTTINGDTLTPTGESTSTLCVGERLLLSDNFYAGALNVDNITCNTIYYGEAQTVPGIHNTKLVKKITFPDFSNEDLIPGFYCVHGGTNSADSFSPPFPDPVFVKEIIQPVTTISPTVAGRWVSKTPMVGDILAVTDDQMPWNYIRTRSRTFNNWYDMDYDGIEESYIGTLLYGSNDMLLGSLHPTGFEPSNSYNQELTVEAQHEPPLWAPLKWYTAGFTVTNSDGTGIFRCISPGWSNSTEPDWNISIGGVTKEVVGILLKPAYSHKDDAQWRCVKSPDIKFAPALHKRQPIPRYPFYWFSETIARLKPPVVAGDKTPTIWGTGSQWFNHSYFDGSYTDTQAGWQQGNQANGWWVHSITINRIGGTEPIQVDIGCMKNGSFYKFGTWRTGDKIKVLWPIYTSDALVYQCTERVDIQAAVINRIVSTSHIASGVITANHITDTREYLNILAT